MSAKSSNNVSHHFKHIAAKVVQPKEKKPINYRMILALPAWVTLAYLISNLLVAGGFLVLDWLNVSLSDYLRPAVMQTGIATVVYLLTIAIVIAGPYYIIKSRTDWTTLGLTRLPSWTDIGLAPAAFAVYALISGVVLALMVSWFPALPLNQTQDVGFQALGSQLDNMLAFVTLVVLAPIAEEVLFRGYLYGKLKGYVSGFIAALVTSLLFAIAHFQLNVAIDVFILSLMLCGLRSLTGSIWAGVLLHMLKNMIAYYILFVSPLLGG